MTIVSISRSTWTLGFCEQWAQTPVLPTPGTIRGKPKQMYVTTAQMISESLDYYWSLFRARNLRMTYWSFTETRLSVYPSVRKESLIQSDQGPTQGTTSRVQSTVMGWSVSLGPGNSVEFPWSSRDWIELQWIPRDIPFRRSSRRCSPQAGY